MLRIFITLFILFISSNAVAKRGVVQEAPASITIMASSSLTNALSELINIYSQRKEISIIAIFDSPTELEYNIQAGDVADVYIGEHPQTLTSLKRAGTLNVYNIVDVAENRLVLVTSKNNRLSDMASKPIDIKKALDKLTNRTLLYIVEPETTWIGYVTKQMLENINQWGQFEPYAVRVANARTNLHLIDIGEGAGIVYYSDAISNKNIKILSNIDPSLHDKIQYHAALVAGNNNMKKAEKFLEFLKTDEAKSVLKKHGFKTN